MTLTVQAGAYRDGYEAGVAAERERCAAICDKEAERWLDEIAEFGDKGSIREAKAIALRQAANDIRALNKREAAPRAE